MQTRAVVIAATCYVAPGLAYALTKGMDEMEYCGSNLNYQVLRTW